MSTYDDLSESNKAHAEKFTHGHLPMPPARGVAVITCMDARLHPEKFLGLELGDGHVIRNAGGRVTGDAIRSLVISQRFLGTDEVVVVHHTDCGMLTFSNEDLVAKVREDLGADASGHDFLPFGDLEQSVLDDVEAVRSSELVPDDIRVTGAIYEVETGRLKEVVRK